jgi:hypothetical protein
LVFYCTLAYSPSSPVGTGKSAFCANPEPEGMARGGVEWWLFYMQLKISPGCDENNYIQDRCPLWCDFAS